MGESGKRYDPTRYDRPSVAVDVVILTILDRALRVLLIRRRQWPYEDHWAFPGGFVMMDESLDEAAARELREETGVTDLWLQQLHTFGDPGRDPRTRVISVAYLAVVAAERVAPCAGSDAADVRWWPVGCLPEMLAFDHDLILAHALAELRSRSKGTAVAFELLPDEFTWAELVNAFQVILGDELDEATLQGEVEAVIEATGRCRVICGRPTELYRYREDAVARIRERRPPV